MAQRPLPARPWLAALALAAAATAVCVPLDPHFSVAGLAWVYLLASVAGAVWLPRGPAVLAAVACVTAFNFFFIPPRYTLDVESPETWWTLVVLLGMSLALGSVVDHLRRGRARAETGERRAAELNALTARLADCADADVMADAAARWLHDTLGHAVAVFVDGDRAQAPAIHGVPADAALFHPASARWALDHARPLGRGCDDWPDLALWCAPFAGRPPGGAVQVLLGPRERPDAATLAHWQALTRQVGLAIGRERAASAARTAEASARSETARNTLLASLSHDLRTPLAALIGTASTLREQGERLPPAQRERLLESLEQQSRDLQRMADNVLQMARLSQPDAALPLEWEAVEDILGAAVQRLRERFRDVRIVLRVPSGLPPVRAEAALLVQVIANLVDNAVRHGAAGRIEILAGRSRDGLFVAVRDHGTGLPPGAEATLFDRFHGPARAGGAGLGLAICQLVVKAHGGRIEARRCDPGTEFRIDLPAAPVEAPAHAGG